MGVSREVYAIYGYKGNYEDFERKECLDYESEEVKSRYKNIVDIEYKPNKICEPILISDGMSGEYSYFGILIFKSGDDRFDDDTDVNFTFDESDIKQANITLNLANKKFNINTNGFVPTLHVFTHYS